MASLKLSGISHWERDRLMILVIIDYAVLKDQVYINANGPELKLQCAGCRSGYKIVTTSLCH